VKRVTHTQGSADWKAWRRAGVGGSDLVAILGLTPNWPPPLPTVEDLFRDKVDGIEREGNFAMHRGQRLEPHARDGYSKRHHRAAPPVCVEHDEFAWVRASLDGLANNGAVIAAEREEWVVEIKCPSWEAHDLALAGMVPSYNAPQLQWQLLATGLSRLDYVSFNPSGRFTPRGFPKFEDWVAVHPSGRRPMPAEWLAVVPVEADAEEQERLLEVCGKFWFEVLDRRAAKKQAVRCDERFAAEVI